VLVLAAQVLMEQYVLAATAAPNAIIRTTIEFSIYILQYNSTREIITFLENQLNIADNLINIFIPFNYSSPL